MYLTVPVAGFAAVAIKAADDYDKGIAKIRAGAGATGEQLNGLTKDMNAQPAIQKILACLKLPMRAPPIAPAISDEDDFYQYQ
jgi:hypothetical protein